MNLRMIVRALLDIVFPNSLYCVSCGKAIKSSSEHGICPVCIEALPYIHGICCSTCGKPIESVYAKLNKCMECIDNNHYFDSAAAVFEYTGVIQKLIYEFKYYGKYSLSECFGSFMAELLIKKMGKDCWHIDYIIPVPLHPNREKERGYNQSAYLAAFLSDATGISLLDDVLIRKIDTPTQTKLSRKERRENLKDAFDVKCSNIVSDKNILLIDDVFTTGSTADFCSDKLKSAGAGRIYVLTIASVVNR